MIATQDIIPEDKPITFKLANTTTLLVILNTVKRSEESLLIAAILSNATFARGNLLYAYFSVRKGAKAQQMIATQDIIRR